MRERTLVLPALLALGLTLATGTPATAAGRHRAPTEQTLAAATPAGVGDFYAINKLTRHVVRFDLVNGRWQTSVIGATIWRDPRQLAVSADGTIWEIDAGVNHRELDRWPAGGSPSGVANVGYPETASLVLDPRGNAFFASGTKLIKVSANGSYVTTVAGAPPADQLGNTAGLGVDSGGRPTTVYLGADRSSGQGTMNVQLATLPAFGGTPTIRKLDEYAADPGAVSDVREAPGGALVMHVAATGGSGVVGLDRVDPASSTISNPAPLLSTNAASFDAAGKLYVVKGRTYCTIPQQGDGCRPDESVDSIAVIPAAGGTATTVPTSGWRVPRGGMAVSAAGRIYASQGTDATDRPLWVIPAGGGAAQQIIVGEFTQLVVPPGR